LKSRTPSATENSRAFPQTVNIHDFGTNKIVDTHEFGKKKTVTARSWPWLSARTEQTPLALGVGVRGLNNGG
jgi:hypothetical protein